MGQKPQVHNDFDRSIANLDRWENYALLKVEIHEGNYVGAGKWWEVDDLFVIDGRFSMYRFHLTDRIPFTHSLHASIEHGHANDCEAHCRFVAYWYGRALE